MACQQTPTATLFGTSVISTFSVSTIVSTTVIDASFIVNDPIIVTTCFPTLDAFSSTICVPTEIQSIRPLPSASTSLVTIFQTFPVVQTFTSPTQTLFTTSCAQSPNDPTVTKPITSTTPTSTITPVVVAPVTVTRTSSSTDPSGNVIISTVAIVSTPSPDSTQSGSENGGPNTTAIIGGAVGGVVVGLIALIGIIWFMKNKRRSTGWNWDDNWEEDEGHQAGAAKIKRGRPAAAEYGSSPNHGVVGSGTPSPLLRGDQPSGVYSHSRSASTATGYTSHRQSNSQAPFWLATSPPHSAPSLHQQQPPAAETASLERTRTPIWARPSEQQGQFHQGYPSVSSDPNLTPTVTSTYGATSYTTAPSTHARTAANPAAAYPPGASPPITGGRRSTYEDYNPPLEQSQHWAARQPSQYQQAGSSRSTTKFVDAPINNSAKSELVAASSASVHTPSIKDRRVNKGGLNGAPTSQAEPPRVVEDAPPAYAQ